MPRVAIPVAELTRSGIAPQAETNGDSVNNHELAAGKGVFLLARNADAGASHDVSLLIAKTVDGQSVTSKVISVPLSASRYIGPFPDEYVQAGNKIYVNVDSSQLKLSAYRVP